MRYSDKFREKVIDAYKNAKHGEKQEVLKRMCVPYSTIGSWVSPRNYSEAQHRYYKKHQKECGERNLNWQKDNPEKIKLYARIYYLKHKDSPKYKEYVIRSHFLRTCKKWQERLKERACSFKKGPYCTNRNIVVLSSHACKCKGVGCGFFKAMPIIPRAPPIIINTKGGENVCSKIR